MNTWESVGAELIHKRPDESEPFFKKVGSETFSKYKAHKRLGYVFRDNEKLVHKLINSAIGDRKAIHVLEIGSFLGQGSKFFVKEFTEHGLNPVVDSVDLMLPYVEEGSNVDYSSQAYHLLKNTEVERMKHQIILHAGRSRDILPHLCKTFDFVYVDGEHTPGGVYLDLVLSLAKSKAGTLLLVDDMTWYDLESVGSGVKRFMKHYKSHIAEIYAHGTKKGEFGFHKIDRVEELKSVKTDQILFVVKEGVDRTLETVLKEIKEFKLHLNVKMNVGSGNRTRRRIRKDVSGNVGRA